MKMIIKKILFVAIVFLSLTCSSATDVDPCVDYSGTAYWNVDNKTLSLILTEGLTGEMIFDLDLKQGLFKGRFHAPLGENAFDLFGSIIWIGLIEKDGSRYSMLLRILSGTEGFQNIDGYIESEWLEEDENVYYAGTFCGKFPEK